MTIKTDAVSLTSLNFEDEWKNFLERVERKNEEELREDEALEEELRLWASYRGQTLTRTGIFYLPLICLPFVFCSLKKHLTQSIMVQYFFNHCCSSLNSKRDDVLSKNFGASGFS